MKEVLSLVDGRQDHCKPFDQGKDLTMQNSTSAPAEKDLSNIITIDEGQIHQHLGEMVRSTVEETLNDMLDAEADRLCNAKRYERSEGRTDGRAGHYKRKLHTKAVQHCSSARTPEPRRLA